MRMLLLLIAGMMPSMAFLQVVPAYPNTESVITCMPDTAGYDVITVGPVDRDYSDLQAAINAASPGSILVLDAGVTFYGGFTLPDKGAGDGWIILMSSRMDLLPPAQIRIDPTAATGDISYPLQSSAMPKIVTNNLSGIPAIKTQARAHHYRLIGLEIAADPTVVNSYGLINLGDNTAAQNTLDKVPHHLIIDRCYIHGHTNATVMKFGVRLDCAIGAIIDSYIADFHSIGFDAQAISGINGPGPFKIINNYLEGAGENILFGGGAPAIPGLVPADIEIRQNHFYKPWSWRVGHPEYAGKHWTIKNLFELKTGKRVLLDGNVLENCWADLPVGQSGYAILLTIRTEGGNSPQADVSDVIISNNIIRHTGAGIALSGSDDGAGNRSSRILITNNVFADINGPLYGDLNIFGPNDGTFLKIGEPRDVWVDHNTILQTGPVTWAYDITDNFIFTHNIAHAFVSSGGYQGIYGPGQSQGNGTIAHYFPDITDANRHLHDNVLVGTNASLYSNYNVTSRNYFPADIEDVGFVNYNNAVIDFRGLALDDESMFKGIATDGTDPGVNVIALEAALTRERECEELPVGFIEPKSHVDLCLIYPNPVTDLLYLQTGLLKDCRYTIRDVHARILIDGFCRDVVNGINVNELTNGIYSLVIQSKDTTQSCLFVMQ